MLCEAGADLREWALFPLHLLQPAYLAFARAGDVALAQERVMQQQQVSNEQGCVCGVSSKWVRVRARARARVLAHVLVHAHAHGCQWESEWVLAHARPCVCVSCVCVF